MTNVSFRQRLLKNSDSGMTLVEVMVAIALLFIIVQGMLTVQLSAITTDVNTQKRTKALFLAQTGMEKARHFNNMSSIPSYPYKLENNVTFTDNPGFTRLTQLMDGDPSGLVKITVSVSWQDVAGNPQVLTLTSLRSNN